MTRSENMRRLWTDPAFRARRSAKAAEHMRQLNEKMWADADFRARTAVRLTVSNRARKAARIARRDAALSERDVSRGTMEPT